MRLRAEVAALREERKEVARLRVEVLGLRALGGGGGLQEHVGGDDARLHVEEVVGPGSLSGNETSRLAEQVARLEEEVLGLRAQLEEAMMREGRLADEVMGLSLPAGRRKRLVQQTDKHTSTATHRRKSTNKQTTNK